MITLTETRIEIADRHTTLHHFRDEKAPTEPMPLGDADGYMGLYAKVLEPKRARYSELSNRPEGAILDKICPVYSASKYWRCYLRSKPDVSFVWREALPMVATIKRRVDIVPPAGFRSKISPTPKVLTYPFGWSTWISIRITGEHSIQDLESLQTALFNDRVFQLSDSGEPLTMQQLFDEVSDGVRTDAFGGKETGDQEGSEFAHVTTVLEKHGGSPALGALNVNEQKQLMHVVKARGAPSRRAFGDLTFRVDGDQALNADMNYMIADELGRFIWMERLLDSAGRNHQWLQCYHHNSFIALVQAWHFEGLLSASAQVKARPTRLQQLRTTAVERLDDPPFKNASLRDFLRSKSLQKTLAANR